MEPSFMVGCFCDDRYGCANDPFCAALRLFCRGACTVGRSQRILATACSVEAVIWKFVQALRGRDLPVSLLRGDWKNITSAFPRWAASGFWEKSFSSKPWPMIPD